MEENSSSPFKISLSIGDPAGIGAEVLIKSISHAKLLGRFTAVVYSTSRFILDTAQYLGVPDGLFVHITSADQAVPNKINIVDVGCDMGGLSFGTPSAESGRCAFLSLERAFQDVRSGITDALITAPIDKKNIQQKGFSFPGHTEYLAAGTATSEYLMLLVSGSLRVGVVTGHIPLRSVADALNTADILRKVKVLDQSLKMDFGIASPRIALLGLNPHAGDGGLLGTEEQTVIRPAVNLARSQDILADGPFPADGFFGSSSFKAYDGILGMYHDQGLIPFKAASFGKGVNFTAGLPIVRCSPDHGTAYDIAGKGKADASSMLQAIELSLEIISRRRTGVSQR